MKVPKILLLINMVLQGELGRLTAFLAFYEIFLPFAYVFNQCAVPFHHFHQMFISTMSQIYKNPNRGQIWGFSWNLENRLYHLRFEVQKIFLYARLNVPRGGIPQGG